MHGQVHPGQPGGVLHQIHQEQSGQVQSSGKCKITNNTHIHNLVIITSPLSSSLSSPLSLLSSLLSPPLSSPLLSLSSPLLSSLQSKDEYGEITKIARPLPLEYLIIELTTTTPIKPDPLLPGGQGYFPTTNRDLQVNGCNLINVQHSHFQFQFTCTGGKTKHEIIKLN